MKLGGKLRALHALTSSLKARGPEGINSSLLEGP